MFNFARRKENLDCIWNLKCNLTRSTLISFLPLFLLIKHYISTTLLTSPLSLPLVMFSLHLQSNVDVEETTKCFRLHYVSKSGAFPYKLVHCNVLLYSFCFPLFLRLSLPLSHTHAHTPTHTRTEWLWTLIAAVHMLDIKPGYITINSSVCALRSIAFGIVDTQQGNLISPACIWGEKENDLLFIINSTKAKDKE